MTPAGPAMNNVAELSLNLLYFVRAWQCRLGRHQQVAFEQRHSCSLYVKELVLAPLGHNPPIAIFCDGVDLVADRAQGAPYEPEQNPAFVPFETGETKLEGPN